MTQHVGRNDPCPCGSGKKYKHCHGGKTSLLGRPGGTPWWVFALIAAAGLVVVALGYRFVNRRSALPRQVPQAGAPGMPGTASPAGDPAPYAYDAQTNRHWDPTHRHWHDGPPPAGAAGPGGAVPTAGPEPSPWTYDPKTGQHWDPNHRHWHQGPPPPPEARGAPAAPDTTP